VQVVTAAFALVGLGVCWLLDLLGRRLEAPAAVEVPHGPPALPAVDA
jgi:hypothetical protein